MGIEKEYTYTNFTLTKANAEKLRAAVFERKIRTPWVKSLKKTITDNLDKGLPGLAYNIIVIWVKSPEDDILEMIDGQHRVLALKELIEEGRITSFPLKLLLIKSATMEEAGKIYEDLNLNSHQANGADILKRYEPTGLYPFFDALKDVCTHYGREKTFVYFNVLKMISYAKTGNSDAVCRADIGEFLKTITPDEIRRIELFFGEFRNIHGEDTNPWFCKGPTIKNTFRIYWERFPGILPKMKKFLTLVSKDERLEKLNGTRTRENVEFVYRIMDGELVKKAGIRTPKRKDIDEEAAHD